MPFNKVSRSPREKQYPGAGEDVPRAYNCGVCSPYAQVAGSALPLAGAVAEKRDHLLRDRTGSTLGFATVMAFSWLGSSLSKGHSSSQRTQLLLASISIGRGRHRIDPAGRLLHRTTIMEGH